MNSWIWQIVWKRFREINLVIFQIFHIYVRTKLPKYVLWYWVARSSSLEPIRYFLSRASFSKPFFHPFTPFMEKDIDCLKGMDQSLYQIKAKWNGALEVIDSCINHFFVAKKVMTKQVINNMQWSLPNIGSKDNSYVINEEANWKSFNLLDL